MATVIALLAVLILVPLLGVLLVRKETALVVTARRTDPGVDLLARVLPLDRCAHGAASGALQCRCRADRRRPRGQLRPARTALPPCRSSPGPGAGSGERKPAH